MSWILLGALPLVHGWSSGCRELGFGSSLLCSSCAKLSEHIGAADPLVAECAGCCAEERAAKKYHRAVLEVCK